MKPLTKRHSGVTHVTRLKIDGIVSGGLQGAHHFARLGNWNCAISRAVRHPYRRHAFMNMGNRRCVPVQIRIGLAGHRGIVRSWTVFFGYQTRAVQADRSYRNSRLCHLSAAWAIPAAERSVFSRPPYCRGYPLQCHPAPSAPTGNPSCRSITVPTTTFPAC